MTLYTSTWCGDCRQAKRFLDEHGIAYEVVKIDQDPAAAQHLEENTGKRGVLYFFFDDKRWVRAYIPRQGFDAEGVKNVQGLG